MMDKLLKAINKLLLLFSRLKIVKMLTSTSFFFVIIIFATIRLDVCVFFLWLFLCQIFGLVILYMVHLSCKT